VKHKRKQLKVSFGGNLVNVGATPSLERQLIYNVMMFLGDLLGHDDVLKQTKELDFTRLEI
jgi:hypothetical protein